MPSRAREVAVANRVNTLRDLETLLAKAGVKLTEGTAGLRRRLPSGAALTVRKAIEWSLGADFRLVPENGAISVLETDRALEVWQKRLDAP